MKVLLVVSCFAVLVYSKRVPSGCGVVCPDIFSPVCGYDPNVGSKNFTNKCRLDGENRQQKTNYTVLHDGFCVDDSCPYACTLEYRPVCGYSLCSGYKNFSNSCFLGVENKCNGTDFSEKHEGLCDETEVNPEPRCDTLCPEIYDPVTAYSPCLKKCQTFSNKCFLNVENRCHPFSHYSEPQDGQCTDDSCQRDCPKIYDPVCGYSLCSGYKNFSNTCLLEVENNCNGTEYSVKHVHLCYETEVNPEPQYGTICPQFFLKNPIVGYSPCLKKCQTFGNECFMKVENQQNPFAHYRDAQDGECEDDSCQRDCPLIYDPVCGYSLCSGYKNFSNTCLLEVENRCNGTDYSIKHVGLCDETEVNPEPQYGSVCSEIYKPVTGYSPCLKKCQTFSNKCFMKVENQQNPFAHYRDAQDGECKDESSPYACIQVYEPVCGYSLCSGYKNFSNSCFLGVENKCNGTDYAVKHDGPCNATEVNPEPQFDMYCLDQYAPVTAYSPCLKKCQTFGNKCYMFAENKRHPFSNYQESNECSGGSLLDSPVVGKHVMRK